ncbi:hypothetical protein LCGC14_1479030 [marine sediment metagenome]|uniref:Uncharacterized protein n=1 Tax=marine sediment metagenome TaxID=412755 RepID=A0A0F9MBQ6_9ZZZZ|nr:hypothetical protein [Candidatus Aminicenantes bacterium]
MDEIYIKPMPFIEFPIEPKSNIRWISIEEAKEMYPAKELDEGDPPGPPKPPRPKNHHPVG